MNHGKTVIVVQIPRVSLGVYDDDAISRKYLGGNRKKSVLDKIARIFS